jgi:hypothetical protein
LTSAGASGLVVGSFAGVIRSSTPFLFALASGIQWFALGSTFWGKWIMPAHQALANSMEGSRQAVLYSWETEALTPRDTVKASAIAGGISGSVGGLLRK